MDWSKGYSSTYYMTIVDPSSWRDLRRIEIIGGSVKRDAKGLRESATIDSAAYNFGVEQWVRVYFDARQQSSSEHIALFTGLATTPSDDFDGVIKENSLDCYSVLKPADDVKLLRGWYAPVGSSGAEVIRQLLSVTPAPVEVAKDSPILMSHIVAEDGETHLTMAEKILKSINWRMTIKGDGTIQIRPKSTEPVITFDPLENDMIENKIKVDSDWFDCPNVFLAIYNDLTAIARDDDRRSPVSTVNRGREVWAQESNCDLANNESIAEYSIRRLKELQRVVKTGSYDRRFLPNIVPSDYVRLKYPVQGLNGVFYIESQSIALTYGARTSEKVSMEEYYAE